MTELLPSGGWDDFLAWWRDKGQNRIFRMFVYKRIFTPYEQQRVYSDESPYEDIYCKYVFIREVINLGNGDYLLGVQETDCEELFEGLEYYRLSEIKLSYYPIDMNEAVELIESLKMKKNGDILISYPHEMFKKIYEGNSYEQIRM